MTEETKPRTVFEVKLTCPHCNKRIIAKKTKKVISEPVPAEYEEKLEITKDAQTTLKDVKKPKKKSKGKKVVIFKKKK